MLSDQDWAQPCNVWVLTVILLAGDGLQKIRLSKPASKLSKISFLATLVRESTIYKTIEDKSFIEALMRNCNVFFSSEFCHPCS